MRRGIIVLLSTLVAIPAAHSGDAAKARQVIERGLKAAGGEAAVKKHQSATFKEKGKYYGMGDGLPYTGNYAMQYPNKFRMEIEGIFTIVIDGKQGWAKMGDMVRELNKDELDLHLTMQRVGWIATLLPLKDKAYSLDLIGESKVGDQPVIGVRVTSKNNPDVSLFFDTKSGLLIKSEYRAKAQEQGFNEVNQEVFYQNHREMDGVQVPSNLVIKRDGKVYIEAEVLEVKAGPLDAKTFSRP